MSKVPSPAALQREARDFRAQFKTVLLATTSAEGVPDASYAPYALDDEGAVCIFVSELARHTRNLLATGRVTLLFIADEGEARNLFARKRLSLACAPTEVARDDPAWPVLLTRLEERLGKTIPLLAQLPDFHLFRLMPQHGSYVRGFGQAFEVAGAELAIGQQQRRG